MICPKGPGDPAREHIDGVEIYKYAPAPRGRGARRLRVGVRLQLAAHRVAQPARPPHGPVRRHPGLQPARHLLAARPAVARGRRAVRVRPPRSEPRAVPLPLRRARGVLQDASSTGCCSGSSGARSARPTTSSRRTSRTRRSPSAAAIAPRRRHGRAQRPGHAADAAHPPRAPALARRRQPRLPRHHGPAGRRRSGAPRGATSSCTVADAPT